MTKQTDYVQGKWKEEQTKMPDEYRITAPGTQKSLLGGDILVALIYPGICSKANARLIAAAPELLEAAKLAEQVMPFCRARKSLREIIAKCEKKVK